jgi:hypothetical protein
MVHMDNSMSHNATKITEKMSWKGLGRAPHPVYSPDISPCDFWAFGTIEGMIGDRHLQGLEAILRAIQEAWSHFLFEDFQNVFKSWMERLIWLTVNYEDSCPSKSHWDSYWIGWFSPRPGGQIRFRCPVYHWERQRHAPRTYFIQDTLHAKWIQQHYEYLKFIIT